MSRRPFYVEQVIEPDEQATIDPVTGKWMLYRLTSIRVPGRKNPVKKRVFTAECSPEGRKEPTTDLGPKPEVKAVEAWEYGLSRVLQAAFPGDWERRYQNIVRPSSFTLSTALPLTPFCSVVRPTLCPPPGSMSACGRKCFGTSTVRRRSRPRCLSR